MSFSVAPFIRILPAFCIGITFCHFKISSVEVPLFLFPAGIIILIIAGLRNKAGLTYRCTSGFALQLMFFSAGYLLTDIRDDRKSERHFTRFSGEKLCLIVREAPVNRSGRLRCTAEVFAIYEGDRWMSSAGRLMVYFSDSTASGILPGDHVIVFKAPAPIRKPKNPGQFDFRKFAAVRRIYHQVHVREGEWIKVSHDTFNLKAIASNLRSRFLSMYREAGLANQEYAVLSALVLGYDDEIDSKTMQAFSASGTLHVLSVSGMHVGIIFTAISAMLAFLDRSRIRFVKVVLLLFSLWFYAFLTGLSPSVIRSATMFSFIVVGSSLNRSSSIYNSLALSALCIFIFFDPLMLFEIGLQLSFLAVAGIAFFYPKIYAWIYLKNFLLDKTWSLVAVSIAAQAATFAISILYFRQFPNYFILANIFIIPLSTAAIFAGIALLFLHPMEMIASKMGIAIEMLVRLLNQSAQFIEELPGSVWNNIIITSLDFILINSIVIALVIFCESRTAKSLFVVIALLSLEVASLSYGSIKRMSRSDITVFSGTKQLSLQVVHSDKAILLCHSDDSVAAFRNSDNLCAVQGLPVENRSVYYLDRLPETFNDDKIFYRGKKLIIGSVVIDEVANGVPPLRSIGRSVYYVGKNYKAIGGIDSGIFLVNSFHKELPVELLNESKIIHNLADSAFTIKL